MTITFQEYYRDIVSLLPQDEWLLFESTLQLPLPISFRILRTTIHTQWVTKFIQNCQAHLQEIQDLFVFGPLSWYPDGSAWQLKASREVLRNHPNLKNLATFLISQSENGVIVRQESVSMIPALFLIQDMETDDQILLDLCAAPGSKTSQLLEALEMKRSVADQAEGLPPRGAVVANDINPTRAHMLCHHLKFQCSSSLIVTLHNAALYPRLFVQDAVGHFQVLKYDGVLCDVPCSGDGTIRKAPRIWKTWDTKAAIGLHRMQMRILKKGISLCKIGGRIVYSTCSFNPIENEAVIAGVMRHAGESVQVEDSKIPRLKCRSGLRTWPVAWRKDQIFKQWNEVPEKLQKHKLWPSMFPPDDQEENLYIALSKCQRYMPQDNDTGGFFVCVLRKVKECPWEKGRPAFADKCKEQAIEECEAPHNSDTSSDKGASSGPEVKLSVPSIQQTDVIPVASNLELKQEVKEQCLLRFGLTDADKLFDLLWYRSDSSEGSNTKRLQKRDRLGNSLRNKKRESEPEREVTDRQPRKILFSSFRAAEILRARTVKCPHRVASGGILFSEIKAKQSPRVAPAAFRLVSALLRSLDSEFEPKITSVTPCISAEMMKEIFTVADTPQDVSHKAVLEEQGSSFPSTSLTEAEVQSKDEGNSLTPYKHLANRLNYMSLPKEHPIRVHFENLSKECHHLFRVDLASKEILYVPIYVGKRNADILITESVRKSLVCLLS